MSKENDYEFDRMFSILNTNDIFQVNNCIQVNDSSDISITNNKFITNIFFNDFKYRTEKESYHDLKLDFKDCMSSDKMQRAQLNVEYMEYFIFQCNKMNVCPIFRYYGLFSHLSSLRCSSDYSDYNQLILKEKQLFEKMIKLDYRIKVIISLDIPIIITKWGYTIEETKQRISNLCYNVDHITNDHNIKIVIDEKNSMDAMFLLDNSLLIRAINIDPQKKYNITKYETNQYVINNTIIDFDSKFSYLEYQNNILRKMLNIDSYSLLIKKVIESRLEHYYRIIKG